MSDIYRPTEAQETGCGVHLTIELVGTPIEIIELEHDNTEFGTTISPDGVYVHNGEEPTEAIALSKAICGVACDKPTCGERSALFEVDVTRKIPVEELDLIKEGLAELLIDQSGLREKARDCRN